MTLQLERLLGIMAQLRDRESGCEWDCAQTHASIVPHTIEEAYEVADAVARQDTADLRDELGDLLFQVVFQARIAEEAGNFTFDDVAAAMCDKLIARHPHVFGTEGSHGGSTDGRWETIKASERASKRATSALDGVALALPALLRAEKLQKRAAWIGFDWPDPSGPLSKVHEELAEFHEAHGEHKVEEAGDLLFAVVNLLRSHGIAAEDALRAGNAKFERRFRAMEQQAYDARRTMAEMSLDQLEALWRAVKTDETQSSKTGVAT